MGVQKACAAFSLDTFLLKISFEAQEW